MKELFSKPNQITIIRVLLIPIFAYFLLSDLLYKNYIAAFIFIILSLSDAIDGYIARKNKQTTKIGKIIDPIADKLLIATALIFLIGRVQLWMAIVIIIREIIITTARILFLPKKVVIPASKLGKIKTISQIIAIVAVILNIPLNWWLMLIAVVITVVSGLDYLVKMAGLVGENVLNLPNIITLLRFFLIPPFIVNLMKANINFAITIFAIIVLSDKLDGISARLFNQKTRLGSWLDPLTDYTLIISTFVVLVMKKKLDILWLILFVVASTVIWIMKMAYTKRHKVVPILFIAQLSAGLTYAAIAAILINFQYKIYVINAALIMIYLTMIGYTIKFLGTTKLFYKDE